MADKNRPQVLSDEDVAQRLEKELPHWTFEKGSLRRRVKTQGWKSTLMVVNAVGHLAEAAWHHPDLRVSYAFVLIKLETHVPKGITDLDFKLAHKIEEFVLWRPTEADAPLEGTPDDARLRYIKYDD